MKDSTKDIIENLQMVGPGDPWWLAKVLLVLALVAGVAAFVAWRLHKKGKLPFLQKPVIPPETTALERLAAIRHLIGEGRVREFVHAASDVLRHYIEARFALRAPRLSTEEFLYEAERSPVLDAGRRARLAKFLFRCDRVKFALGDLDAEAMEALYEAAENFIRESAVAVPAGGEQP